jgi:hypothetical protein
VSAFGGQPVKTFDFYIHVNLNVCIFDKIFSKQAARKAPAVIDNNPQPEPQ